MNLSNKVALITGASKGIGYGIALGMAQEGADVLVNYCTDKEGAKKAAEGIKKMGRKVLVVQADVSKASQVDQMAELGLKTFGKIDILVNNAGIAIWKPFFEKKKITIWTVICAPT